MPLTAKCCRRAELGALLKTPCCGDQEAGALRPTTLLQAPQAGLLPHLFFSPFNSFCSTAAAHRGENLLAICPLSWSRCGCACASFFFFLTLRPQSRHGGPGLRYIRFPSCDCFGFIQVNGWWACLPFTHTHTHGQNPE